MADINLLQFHAQSLREYATLWFDPEVRQERNVSEEEAAFHLCEHAAMLFRYTGQETCLKGLTVQPPEQRRSLVLAVCRYLGKFTLADTSRRLLSADALDPDQLTELEDLVIERDSVEEVLTLATRLGSDLIREGDGDLRRHLATARSTVAELDDLLWERPDAVSVACRALGGLRSQLASQPDNRAQWWFGKAVALDEIFETESIHGLLGIAPAARHEPSPHVIPLSAFLFTPTETPVRLAAADESSRRVAVSLDAIVPQLPGVRVVVTRLTPDAYQFIFIDEHSGERSMRLDGHHLVATLAGGSVSSPIGGGVVLLRTEVPFDSCRLETTDGQVVGTLVLDKTHG